MLAIAVGTAALIIVLSVFNGFEDIVKGLYGDFYSDVRITPAKGKFTSFTPDVVKKIAATPGIEQMSFFVEEKAVLMNGDYQTIVYLKGVDAAYDKVSKVSNHIERGNYNVGTDDEPALVAGSGISNAVGADPDNKLSDLIVYLPNRKATNFNNLDAMHSYNVVTSGIFAIQQEFDDKYAFTNLKFMQYMLDLKNDEYSGVDISLKPGVNEFDVSKQLSKIVGNNLIVKTRYEQNQGLFSVMQIEKWVIYGILSLILVVAAFNMIGALTMLVLEKQKDISILQGMGASTNMILKIFLSEGLLLGAIGSVIGIALALIICFLQVKFHLIKLAGGSFLIDYFPVKLQLADFVLVSATAGFIAFIASWFPARKAAAQKIELR